MLSWHLFVNINQLITALHCMSHLVGLGLNILNHHELCSDALYLTLNALLTKILHNSCQVSTLISCPLQSVHPEWCAPIVSGQALPHLEMTPAAAVEMQLSGFCLTVAWWFYMASWIWINFNSGNGLLPIWFKPLTEPMLPIEPGPKQLTNFRIQGLI